MDVGKQESQQRVGEDGNDTPRAAGYNRFDEGLFWADGKKIAPFPGEAEFHNSLPAGEVQHLVSFLYFAKNFLSHLTSLLACFALPSSCLDSLSSFPLS